MTRSFVIALTLCSVGLTRDASLSRPIGRSALVERIAINDNRAGAGILRDGVLTIRLEARRGDWRPDGDTDPGIVVAAFAEEGKPLQIPGPLIRVPRGTAIHAFVRNSLPDSTLFVHGLYTRGARGPDTVQVKPGEVREVRFDAGAPGTYFYWATTGATAAVGFRGPASQLSGAFVVDSSTALGPPRDRVFVLGFWTPGDNTGIIARSDVNRFVINGKSWPHTERLTYTVGDSVRFRIVNTSTAPHPMPNSTRPSQNRWSELVRCADTSA